MPTEQVILVDENNDEIGTEEKLRAHRDGKLHRAFSVFVFDAQRRLLLQKRATDKYHSGGLWSNTCCGHPRPGEALTSAAERRLKEELRFDCTLNESFHFVYRKQFSNGLIEHEFDHIVVGRYDGEPDPDPSEAESCRWVSLDTLDTWMRASPEEFTFWFTEAVQLEQWNRLTRHL